MATFCDSPLVTSPVGQSDHNSLICSFKDIRAKNVTTKVKSRKYHPANKAAFGKWLADFNWTPLYREVSCEQKLAIFQNVLEIGLEIFFPSKTVKLHDKDKPWVTPEFKKIILNRQKAYHDGKSEQYRRLRNLSNRLSTKLRLSYLQKMVDQLKSNPNPKRWWECIKQLAGYPKKKVFSTLVLDDGIVEGKALANKINDAFISVTQEMTSLEHFSRETQIQIEKGQRPIPPECVLSEESVYQKLAGISTTKSSGPDQTPNWVLKDYAYILASPVSSILNASIQQACVPTSWKEADVTPIPKISAPVDVYNDLRPISLTPTLSKICESFVADWLINSIKGKIDERQFGSLKNTSTTHNLISLIHHLLSETDAARNVIRVFLIDFSKAFDRIDHSILLHKLIDMNVPSFIIDWIRSFLTDRKQRVKLRNSLSDWHKVNGGVPQGTVLGPVLFLVMINDLLTDWPDRWKYVDDCTVTESISPGRNSNLQNLVDYIFDWSVANKMKLNVTKCKEMVIDFSKEKRNFAPLLINDVPVERVKATRILGIILQDNMNWNDHVHQIVRKAGKRLYMLRLLKRSNANLKILCTVFTTIIRPVVEYACQVWHFNIQQYLCDEIEKIQRRALKIMLPSLSYREARELADLPLLKTRRDGLCDQFFAKNGNKNNIREHLIPKTSSDYDLRSTCKYMNFLCKTDRFRNSFLPQIISKENCK